MTDNTEFLNKLSSIIDVIVSHLNYERPMERLKEEFNMSKHNELEIGMETHWGTYLVLFDAGRYLVLVISCSEYFQRYKRMIDYHMDYLSAEAFLCAKFPDILVKDELDGDDRCMQNYCYWRTEHGYIGIQQSDSDGSGDLVTELIFIPNKWVDKLSIPVGILPS